MVSYFKGLHHIKSHSFLAHATWFVWNKKNPETTWMLGSQAQVALEHVLFIEGKNCQGLPDWSHAMLPVAMCCDKDLLKVGNLCAKTLMWKIERDWI